MGKKWGNEVQGRRFPDRKGCGVRDVESWGQEDGGTVSLPSTRLGQKGRREAESAGVG